MDLLNDLFNGHGEIILTLLGLIGVLLGAYIWARTELNASKREVQDAVGKKDDAKRQQADLAAKLTEADINARYPY
jgi:hypothetical protein